MLIVGLTGGIGSGKTIIAEVFKHLGIPVFNADNEAKSIVNSNETIVQKIKMEFGATIYEKNEINRRALAEIVFKNPEKLKVLNSIIHPEVRNTFINWCEKNKSYPYVIEEAAILFESGAYKEMDYTINVCADELTRINRVILRDGTSIESVKERMKNQLTDKERSKMADFNIINDGSLMVLPQILDIHQKLLHQKL